MCDQDIEFFDSEDVKPVMEDLVGSMSIVGEDHGECTSHDVDMEADIKQEFYSPHISLISSRNFLGVQSQDSSALVEGLLHSNKPHDIFCAGATGLFFK